MYHHHRKVVYSACAFCDVIEPGFVMVDILFEPINRVAISGAYLKDGSHSYTRRRELIARYA